MDEERVRPHFRRAADAAISALEAQETGSFPAVKVGRGRGLAGVVIELVGARLVVYIFIGDMRPGSVYVDGEADVKRVRKMLEAFVRGGPKMLRTAVMETMAGLIAAGAAPEEIKELVDEAVVSSVMND